LAVYSHFATFLSEQPR